MEELCFYNFVQTSAEYRFKVISELKIISNLQMLLIMHFQITFPLS